MDIRIFSIPCLAALAACTVGASVQAQELRLGVARADHVVLARQVGVQPLGSGLVLHRFETVETWKGDAPATFTVPVPTRVADQPRPEPARTMVCCLRARHADGDAELPERYAPYFDLTGYRGDHVAPDGERATASLRTVVAALVRSERGERPATIAGELVGVVLRGHGPARLEAAEVLRGRPVLAGAISQLERDSLQTLALGETDDVPLKVAVASLVVEIRGETALPTLLPALRTCHDARFALAIGRLARFCHEDAADAALAPFVGTLDGDARAAGLLALGATRTDGALDRLLKLRERDGASPAIDAALRAHGSAKALEAVGDRDVEVVEPSRKR